MKAQPYYAKWQAVSHTGYMAITGEWDNMMIKDFDGLPDVSFRHKDRLPEDHEQISEDTFNAAFDAAIQSLEAKRRDSCPGYSPLINYSL